ncbi:MAG: NADP-dependent oxidoreductase [Bdellovibrionales bacterium]|nr:NADP-dependent oxidoreductase [Bdellovibrionales bacterium]
MKVARIYSYGGSDEIKIEDSEQPQISKNEVLVKIHDAGINPIDWKIREGYMKPATPHFPLTLGQDFSGDVIDVGGKVSGFKKGDRVFGFAHGSYAEFATATPEKIALIPKSLDYETAASIPTAGLTAWQLLIQEGHVKADQNVLIHGAAGGVGSFACQIAIWKKANVIATAAADDIPYLQKLGVKKIIDYKTKRFEEFAKDIDIVIDLVGGDTLSRSYQLMKKRGIALSTVGSYKDSEASKFGAHGVNFVMTPNAKDLAELASLVANKTLKPRVSEILPLTDVKRAQDLNQKGHTHGKVLLRMM